MNLAAKNEEKLIKLKKIINNLNQREMTMPANNNNDINIEKRLDEISRGILAVAEVNNNEKIQKQMNEMKNILSQILSNQQKIKEPEKKKFGFFTKCVIVAMMMLGIYAITI